MSLSRRIGRIDDKRRHGVFRTTNTAAQQTDEEREEQERVVSGILRDLGLNPSDITELSITNGTMRFVLPPNTQNAVVVGSYGGKVIEDVPKLGTRVSVPLHFGSWRKQKLVKNPLFAGAVALMVGCGLWVTWAWMTNENIWSDIAFGYKSVAGHGP